MAGKLETYGDWVSLIGEENRCTSEMYNLLIDGRFEATASSRIFSLVQGYCERCINRETKRLATALRGGFGSDAEGLQLICSRYSRACERTLFFTSVDGFPAEEGLLLRNEISSHVSRVFASLKKDYEKAYGPACEDAVRQLRKFLSYWLGK